MKKRRRFPGRDCREPIPTAPIPGGHELAAPHAQTGLTGLTFLGHVIIRELPVGKRPALGHHSGVDILAIGGADGTLRSRIMPRCLLMSHFMFSDDAEKWDTCQSVRHPSGAFYGLAGQLLSRNELDELTPGRDAAGPRHTFNSAGLGFLGCVDAMKPDALAGHLKGIAVNDAGRAGDGLGPSRGGQQEDRQDGQDEAHGPAYHPA